MRLEFLAGGHGNDQVELELPSDAAFRVDLGDLRLDAVRPRALVEGAVGPMLPQKVAKTRDELRQPGRCLLRSMTSRVGGRR